MDHTFDSLLAPLAVPSARTRQFSAGLLAPKGEVDKVLDTVVSNLEITNNLDIQPEVQCRVLLTSPLESFSVGHVIVLSRGLIDTLPDEASLAAVLARELAHIALAHRLDTKYAFSDRMLFDDARPSSRSACAVASTRRKRRTPKRSCSSRTRPTPPSWAMRDCSCANSKPAPARSPT